MNLIYKVYDFYVSGFSSMKVGKRLWIIICIKLFIMFAILKIFFFPNILEDNFQTDEQRSNHVLENLTKGGQSIWKE